MKKLFIKALLLVLPFGVILSFVEYRLRQIPNSYATSKAEMEKVQANVEVLITGPSHTQSGVATQYLSRPAFNLANGSQSIYYDTKLVEKYAATTPKLKLVIFTLSYHSLRAQLKNSMERWRSGFYKQVFGIRPEDESRAFRLSDYSYIGLYSPKLAYKIVWDDLFHKTGPNEVVSSIDQSQDEISSEFGKKRVKLHETEMSADSVQPNVESLEQAIKLLQAKGIKVVFLTVPAHHTYYENIDPAIYQEMQAVIKKLCDTYGIEYFNFLHDIRFGDGDFLNSDHLNESGAKKFSLIIDKEIIQNEKD